MKHQSAFQKFMAAMPRILVAAAIILGCSLFIIVYVKFESLNKRINALESANAGKLPCNQRRRELSNARLRTRLEQMEGDIRITFEEYDSKLALIPRRLENGSNSIKEDRLLISDSMKQLTAPEASASQVQQFLGRATEDDTRSSNNHIRTNEKDPQRAKGYRQAEKGLFGNQKKIKSIKPGV